MDIPFFAPPNSDGAKTIGVKRHLTTQDRHPHDIFKRWYGIGMRNLYSSILRLTVHQFRPELRDFLPFVVTEPEIRFGKKPLDILHGCDAAPLSIGPNGWPLLRCLHRYILQHLALSGNYWLTLATRAYTR